LFPLSLGLFLPLLFCFKPEIFMLRTAGFTGLRGKKGEDSPLTLAEWERCGDSDPNYSFPELILSLTSTWTSSPEIDSCF
jgi:hypothetical protein